MERRVDVPCVYEAPSAWIESFRQIDPAVELIYLCQGTWALGSWSPPDSARRRAANEMLARIAEAPLDSRRVGQYRLAKAAQQGFRIISRYPRHQIDSGFALRDFRIADWEYRKSRDRAFEKALEASMLSHDDPRREDALRENAMYRAKDAWTYFMKNRKHFVQ